MHAAEFLTLRAPANHAVGNEEPARRLVIHFHAGICQHFDSTKHDAAPDLLTYLIHSEAMYEEAAKTGNPDIVLLQDAQAKFLEAEQSGKRNRGRSI